MSKQNLEERVPSKEESMDWVGKSVQRVDGKEKVTGSGVFTVDFELPHMLYGKIHRSRYPHAEIKKISIEKALEVPGVRAIITGEDVPKGLRGRGLLDTPILAQGKVRYIGEPIAAVAADTSEAAEEAAGLIEVDYKILPAEFDPEDALQANPKVVIHPNIGSYKRLKAQIYKSISDPSRPNVSNHYRIIHGDIEEGFRHSEVIVENRFSTHAVQHAHIEPVASVAKFDSDGTYTVWTSGQNVYRTRRELSDALLVPETRIRVIAMKHVGGGFGNKGAGHIEAICACLAKQTGRPVKIVLTREEVFASTSIRHPSIIYVKDGLSKDGEILAREVKVIYNGGAYSLAGNVVNKNAIHALTSVYRAKNFKAEIYRVYTNQVQGGAFRGFGAPQVVFAIESQMDIDAERIGMDPIAFRKKNLLRNGELSVIGERISNNTIDKCIDAVTQRVTSVSVESNSEHWKHGVGFAISKEQNDVSYASAASVRLLEDGTFVLLTAATDPGEGTHTILAQIVANEMRVAVNDVRMVVSDTLLTPVGTGASGSRQTSQMGMAVKLACQDLKSKIQDSFARKLGVDRNNISFEDGKVEIRGVGTLGYGDVFSPGPMGGAFVPGEGYLEGKGFYLPKTGEIDPASGQTTMEKAALYYTPVAQAAVVAVNIETGQLKILNYISAIDVGHAINPMNVVGQNEGGIAMGVNGAVNEELVISRGKVINPNLRDYKLQSIMDYFPIESIILENPNPDGPYGARGMGEAPITPTAAVVANAVYNAVGIRIKDLPITPEKILLAIRERKKI
jgi:CO/xanthine dehydrogenase Mo-binding subunit